MSDEEEMPELSSIFCYFHSWMLSESLSGPRDGKRNLTFFFKNSQDEDINITIGAEDIENILGACQKSLELNNSPEEEPDDL
jgi:hypothetical protein